MSNLLIFDPRCENLKNPICIDKLHPKFSWINIHKENNQQQTAYLVIVSSDLENILSEKGDLWDSGKIVSSNNTSIYMGNKIGSSQKYFWRVKWWDKNNIESDFSEVSFFETAFLDKSDWTAKWITKNNMTEFRSAGTFLSNQYMGEYIQCHAPYFRKEFSVSRKIKKAKIFVSGLGYYELRLNGKKVGNHVLDPGQTDYQKFALYSTYDITDDLKEKNAIGVILGNGRHIKYYGFESLKFILQLHLEYEDGRMEKIVSDETWRASHGPLPENSIYNGEKYDARLEMPGWDTYGFDESKWDISKLIEGPELGSQLAPPIRITKLIKPKKIISPKPDVFVFDFEQNFSGWIRLEVQGPKGAEIKIRYSENVYEDGSINVLANQKAESMNTFILKGDGIETYEPRFTYHGFRYVEITGFPGIPRLRSILGCFVHSDVEQTGEFYCSNELINKIHKNIIWGQLANLMSVPTDCSQRDERHGWMGDAHLSGEQAIYNFDMYSFYKKYLHDIKLSQKEDGSISDVVPPYYRNLYPADPAWGAAYMIFTWYLYEFYGDEDILSEHYETLKKYVEFLKSQSDKHIIRSLGKFGDWCPPGSVPPKMTPVELTATWFYFHDTFYLSLIAKILKKDEDAKFYSSLANEIKAAFNSEFLIGDMYKSHTLVATENLPSQTSQALPLFLDMVPENKIKTVFDKLLHSVINRCDYHVDTGIVGTRYLLDVLSKYGCTDVAYKVATNKTYPGWGYMVEQGATTLWERWEYLTNSSMNSHNHIMFGSVGAWFYRIIAGLSCLTSGWSRIKFQPPIIKDLKFAIAKIETVKGTIEISWQKSDDDFNLNIRIPVGSIGEVYIPLVGMKFELLERGNLIGKDGKIIDNKTGISAVEVQEKYLHFESGSGVYYFKLKKS